MGDFGSGIIAAAVVIAGLWAALIVLLWLHRPTREVAAVGMRILPDVVRLLYRLARDAATPVGARVALVVLAGYLAMPIDLIPDFVPGIGALDDVILVLLVLRWVGRRVAPELLAEHWSGSLEGLAILRRLLD